MTHNNLPKAKPKHTDAIMEILANNKKAIQSILPKHLTPERVLRIAYMTVNSSNQLRNCHPISIMNAVIEASKLGLEIGQHAHIVPFKQTAQLIVDYKGYIALAYRSDMVKSFYFHPVYSSDFFKYTLGLNKDLIHEPSDQRGELKAAYACIHFKSGGSDFEVIERRDAEATKARAPGARRSDSPWNTEDEPIMWCKTAVRRLAKRVPQSPDFQRAAFLEEMVMAGLQQPNLISSLKSEEGGTDLGSVDLTSQLRETSEQKKAPERTIPPENFPKVDEEPQQKGTVVTSDTQQRHEKKQAETETYEPQMQSELEAEEAKDENSGHPWDHANWKGLKSGFASYLLKHIDSVPKSLEPTLRKKWFNIKSLQDKPFPLDPATNAPQETQEQPQQENIQSEANGEASEQKPNESEIDSYPPTIRAVVFELAELNNCLPEEISPRVLNSALKTNYPEEWEAVRNEKNFGYMPTTDEGAVFWNIAIGNKVEDNIPF